MFYYNRYKKLKKQHEKLKKTILEIANESEAKYKFNMFNKQSKEFIEASAVHSVTGWLSSFE